LPQTSHRSQPGGHMGRTLIELLIAV